MRELKSTTEIEVPKRLIDQVLGQDNCVELIKKAAVQKRNVLLVGLPGTGKSMLAQAMAELMPVQQLHDVLVYPNDADPNTPKIRVVRAGEGNKTMEKARLDAKAQDDNTRVLGMMLPFMWFVLSVVIWQLGWVSDIVFSATILLGGFIMVGFVLSTQMRQRTQNEVPKLLIDNSGKKVAPFTEATGARAGALLGDVRHDPLQTFFPNTAVFLVESGKPRPTLLRDLVDGLLEKYPGIVNRTAEKLQNHEILQISESADSENYEAVVLPEDRLPEVLGFVDGRVQSVKLLGVNKRNYSGKMVKVNSGSGSLIVTPEHKIFTSCGAVEAQKLSGSEKIAVHEGHILSEDDVIGTFSEFDKTSARAFARYQALKSANPEYGYKRTAKMLSLPQGRVRWWHTLDSKPKAVKTADSLKELGLLPLRADDPRLPAIARVLGATFGDGGIAGNLNNIFMSSAERGSLNDFKSDIASIFGNQILGNFSEIISGLKGTGKCVRNSNRAVVRFFVALGAPVGRKNKEIEIPRWIYLNRETANEFFGAFLGNELCSPKFSEKYKYINEFAVALCGDEALRANRLKFLTEVSDFLAAYGIKTTQIYENEFRKNSFMWKLCISKGLENIARFAQFIPLRYSDSKKARIERALADLSEWKGIRKNALEAEGKSPDCISSVLRISGRLMEQISLKREFAGNEIHYTGAIYNLTTSSGNVVANNIIASNSGGLGTPPHLRIEPGMIHRVSGGVLFLDEIATLSAKAQQELLTAMQEKKYPITGQSELSSGAMTRTEPVPCDFVLVGAGNYEDLQKIHPALRSRIRGYGYEIYMNLDMPDTQENRDKLVQFVAQEVAKDGKIPHFSPQAVETIVFEARRRAGRKNCLTLKLRDLGGLVRASGDIARHKSHELVEEQDVIEAKMSARTLEQQMVNKMMDEKRDYDVYLFEGSAIGRVNGLAVSADGDAGMVLPIEAEVAPAASRDEGRIIATGKLGEIAKEAVQNVSAIIKRLSGKDVSKYDLHIQFLQTYSGVEGDSASVSVATAVISSLERIPVKQSLAMTGSLSVRGEVLPVGGVTAKVAAAIKAGFIEVVVPKANKDDIILPKEELAKIKVIPAENIQDVLDAAFVRSEKTTALLKSLKSILNLENHKLSGLPQPAAL